jgi:hypothetical protein
VSGAHHFVRLLAEFADTGDVVNRRCTEHKTKIDASHPGLKPVRTGKPFDGGPKPSPDRCDQVEG